MGCLTIEEVGTEEEFLSLEPVWNDVVQRSDMDHPFFTFEWLSTWWKAFGKNKELFILLVKDGAEIIAIAPLMKVRMKWRGMPVSAVSLMTNEHSYRSGIIIGKNDERIGTAIVDHLQASACRCDIMKFDLIPQDSLSYKILRDALELKEVAYVEMRSSHSPYIAITGSWDDYLKNRSRNLRSKLKLTFNQMKRQDSLEAVQYTSADISQAIAEVLAISRNTWKYKAGTAIASDPASTFFYASLAEKAAAKGWLSIRVLKLKGTPVAFTYNLDYGKKSYYLKTGFNEAYRNLSTGGFLIFTSIKECFEKGFVEYDLLGSSEAYKMQLTPLFREQRKSIVFGNSLFSKPLYFFETVVMPRVKHLFSKKQKIDLTGAVAVVPGNDVRAGSGPEAGNGKISGKSVQ